MIKPFTNICDVMNATFNFGLETMKEMSTNRRLPMLALIALISFSLAGCGGGSMASSPASSTPSQPSTANGHPTGMWSTLPV